MTITGNQNRLTRDMALVLCGMFARSNMGLGLPTREEISWAKQAELKTPRTSAEFLCLAFGESDAVAAMVAAVAEAWLKRLSGLTLGEVRKGWPDVVDVYEGG